MIIQTTNASFLIENCEFDSALVAIHSDSRFELSRLFGSVKVKSSDSHTYPFTVRISKQEFTDSLILLIKEIDYTSFSQLESNWM
ncbi:hypothetical protein SAMN04488519_107177 [Algoriphagus ornithinivorans]|uniref:Uncharacterized protein n=1 Tax=Algoriphagus ornithinivorans TaxID=226506 RepID=A0A1I5HPA1_9BACT|nr:hypothetical protein [Algoriphagus ornithinivorans]SFO50073.1 hypothetical protein SAMN04488519_107177 [Algoriphagus ornithinivorans]